MIGDILMEWIPIKRNIQLVCHLLPGVSHLHPDRLQVKQFISYYAFFGLHSIHRKSCTAIR